MRCFLTSLVPGLHHIGLESTLDKTEVIPPCTSPRRLSNHLTSLEGSRQLCATRGCYRLRLGATLSSIGALLGLRPCLMPLVVFLTLREAFVFFVHVRAGAILYSCRTVSQSLQHSASTDRDIRAAHGMLGTRVSDDASRLAPSASPLSVFEPKPSRSTRLLQTSPVSRPVVISVLAFG